LGKSRSQKLVKTTQTLQASEDSPTASSFNTRMSTMQGESNEFPKDRENEIYSCTNRAIEGTLTIL
jgi:hypothetical protein